MSVNDPASLNLVALVGVLHRPPQLRLLKSGDQVVNLDLHVDAGNGRVDIVPVSWFDAPASAFDMAEGDRLAVVGRVRRQWFGARNNFTDVVAASVVPVRSTAKWRRSFGNAMAMLQHAAP